MPPLNLLLTFTLPPDQLCNPGSLMPGQMPRPRPTSGGSKVMQWWCKYSTAEKKSWARRTNECEECRKSDVHSLLCHFSSERQSVWLSARPTGLPDSSGSEWHHRDQPANTLFHFFKEDVFGFCLLQVFCNPHLHPSCAALVDGTAQTWPYKAERLLLPRNRKSVCVSVFVSFCLQTKILAFFFFLTLLDLTSWR